MLVFLIYSIHVLLNHRLCNYHRFCFHQNLCRVSFILISTVVDKKWLNILERPSTTVADHEIVIMCNNKTKEQMHEMLEQSLLERGIDTQHRTKLGQNIM